MSTYPSERHTGFLGTYFNATAVLRLARAAKVLAWVVLLVYLSQFSITLLVYILQVLRGFWGGIGLTDVAQNILNMFSQPLQGVFYFVVLLAVSHLLLLFLDIEDNTRRAARRSERTK